MNSEERQHLEELLQTYQRRLRPLEKQEALYGPRTAPEILIEIEETKERIAKIEISLGRSELSEEMGSPERKNEVPSILITSNAESVKLSEPSQTHLSSDSTRYSTKEQKLISTPQEYLPSVTTSPLSTAAVSTKSAFSQQHPSGLLSKRFWFLLWRDWVLVTIAGFILSSLVNYTLTGIITTSGNLIISGIVIGFIQWLFLRHFLSRSNLLIWIVIHLITWIVLFPLSLITSFVLGPIAIWYFTKSAAIAK